MEAQGSSAAAARPLLMVTVEDAAHTPVMERGLNCLYQDSSRQASAFSGLTQQQLVLAVKYGDMVQFQPAVEESVNLLMQAVVSEGLFTPTLEALCGLGRCPESLTAALPDLMKAAPTTGDNSAMVKKLLLNALGDLEHVLQHSQSLDTLMRLQLPAMELLLSSDELKVSSEDTVMYTIGEYVCRLPRTAQAAASDTLSRLMRCQHLSEFQLMAQAVNTDTTAFNVLKKFQGLVRRLCTIKRVPRAVLLEQITVPSETDPPVVQM